ncbi:hypothetical protein J1N35_040642 [Gossypium stocksii]|uniref:phosphatidate cytidylyltransferase n=1 Tax=Gossypium stocksii TaxID=47602 RepID=A0A9D3UDZ4_9ROSI|nr:hypothetical protein J1N35_040642 [Gossypium stocksii]
MTKFRKLNRPTGHRMSMFRFFILHYKIGFLIFFSFYIVSFVLQLQNNGFPVGKKHERIETTVAKAKEIRRLADNMVQLGKEVSSSSVVIVIKDIFAYVVGFFFGRTPLIKLSPKKTWEGFIGASVTTMISAFVCRQLAKIFQY